MVTIRNLFNDENPNVKTIAQMGCYTVLEHQKDLSVTPSTAVESYFMSQMNVRKRQVVCTINGNMVKTQAGAMQWTSGNVTMDSGVHSAGGFFGKAVKGAVTGEAASKPEYTGQGLLMLEPTFNHVLLENVANWGSGLVMDDGLFLACDGNLQESIVKRSNFSSAVFGGEGLFNLCLSGQGVAVLESPVPREELVEFNIENDEVRIDGNFAIAWSSSLQFTTEKSTKSLFGSAISGEGLVNVYRGTGRILLAPTRAGSTMTNMYSPAGDAPASSSTSSASTVTKALGGLFG